MVHVKTMAVAAVMSTFAAAGLASNTCTSSPAAVFLSPGQTHLWSTGCGSHFSVPIEYPDGATQASLKVTGDDGYSRTYAELTGGSVTVDLPAAVSPETENVYTLTLTFVGSDMVRTARLGAIFGYDGSETGHTRCIGPSDSRRWGKVRGSAVFPIPAGATSLTIGGKSVELDPDRSAGWYRYAAPPADASEICSLFWGGENYEALLWGAGGTLLFLR